MSTFSGQGQRPLQVVTYLAPQLFWFYQYISRYLAKKLRFPTRLSVGSNYDQLPGQVDLAFICGLPYIELESRSGPCFEPMVAPVLQGKRYGEKPIYFSDVVVRRDSPFRTFADLRGQGWAYNEPHSQSVYGISRSHLVQSGETDGYFGKVVEAGYHERAIRMVHTGVIDASAIDSHVLEIMMRDEPALKKGLRVIATLGPSTSQPILVARRLLPPLKDEIRRVLLEMGNDPLARAQFDRARVERFESVTDSTYHDIRRMLAEATSASFLTSR